MLAVAYAGPSLQRRNSPLMDESFLAGLRRDGEDAKRSGIVPADADLRLEGWVEPKYLRQALRDLNLEDHWPEYDADGNAKPRAAGR